MQTVIETKTGYMIKCPVCKWHEFPKVGKSGASWSFNGNYEKPTFTPSMNEAVGPFPEGSQWAGQIRRCHFVLTDGKLNFCGDCSHELSGRQRDLESFSQEEIDYYALLLKE